MKGFIAGTLIVVMATMALGQARRRNQPIQAPIQADNSAEDHGKCVGMSAVRSDNMELVMVFRVFEDGTVQQFTGGGWSNRLVTMPVDKIGGPTWPIQPLQVQVTGR